MFLVKPIAGFWFWYKIIKGENKMSDSEYACFVEFVEMNNIQEKEWDNYFECYFQLLKEM
jgi:hypothetical protein